VELLGREIGRRGAGDPVAQIAVGHVAQGVRQLAGEGLDLRDGAERPGDGSSRREGVLSDPEAKLAHLDAALEQPFADGRRQERELVRPHAARHLEDEHPVLQRHGTRPVRDARAHRVAPKRRLEGRTHPREAVLPRPLKDGVERLGRVEGVAAASLHRPVLSVSRVACRLSPC
jgi:hypothetical protein